MSADKPLLVGSFALGGLVLGVVAIFLFGGQSLFASKIYVLAVFKGSVSGLDVGSDVTFRGVSIGKVKSIKVLMSSREDAGLIPVTLELDRSRISWTAGRPKGGDGDWQRSVDAGLRVKLVSQSLVTGRLSVDLDFYPGTKIELAHAEGGIFELPTLPSRIQDLEQEIRALKLHEVADAAHKALVSAQRDLDELGTRIGPIADSLQKTLDATTETVYAVKLDLARTLGDIDKLAVAGGAQLATSGKAFDSLLAKTERTEARADDLLASLNDMVAPRSPMRGDLQATLRDLAASSNSLRHFTRELEANPVGTLLERSAK